MTLRHPEPELLLEYASGSVSVASSIAVTTHLHYCDQCDHAVQSLQHVGGDILSQAEALPVSEDLFDRVLGAIEADAPEAESVSSDASRPVDAISDSLPGYVRKLLPQGSLSWKFLSPALRVATISVGEDANEVALHRIKPGGRAPEHDHQGQEITVVLKGSFSDEDGIYQPGDFIVRNPGDVHRPYSAQNEECICLSVLSAPIKLTGLKRILNPVLGFSPS